MILRHHVAGVAPSSSGLRTAAVAIWTPCLLRLAIADQMSTGGAKRMQADQLPETYLRMFRCRRASSTTSSRSAAGRGRRLDGWLPHRSRRPERCRIADISVNRAVALAPTTTRPSPVRWWCHPDSGTAPVAGPGRVDRRQRATIDLDHVDDAIAGCDDFNSTAAAWRQ